MKKTTNYKLALYEKSDEFAITSSSNSLNGNMNLIDENLKSLDNRVESLESRGGDLEVQLKNELPEYILIQEEEFIDDAQVFGNDDLNNYNNLVTNLINNPDSFCFVNDINLGQGNESKTLFTNGTASVEIEFNSWGGTIRTRGIDFYNPWTIGCYNLNPAYHPVEITAMTQGDNISFDYDKANKSVKIDVPALEPYARGIPRDPTEIPEGAFATAAQVNTRLDYHAQGMDCEYRLTSSGWKRVMYMLRSTSGWLELGLNKVAPNGMCINNIGLVFSGYTAKKNMANNDTKPMIYQLFNHTYGETAREDYKPCKITKVRIGYPDPTLAKWPNGATSGVDSPGNPVNCYLDVFAEYDESMQATNYPVDFGLHAPVRSMNHNCFPIKEETDAIDTGIYGEPLVYEEFLLSENTQLAMDGHSRIADLSTKNLSSNTVESDKYIKYTYEENGAISTGNNYKFTGFTDTTFNKIVLADTNNGIDAYLGVYRRFNMLYNKLPVGSSSNFGVDFIQKPSGAIIINGTCTRNGGFVKMLFDAQKTGPDTPIYLPKGTYNLYGCELLYIDGSKDPKNYSDNDLKNVYGYARTAGLDAPIGYPLPITWEVTSPVYVLRAAVRATYNVAFNNQAFIPCLYNVQGPLNTAGGLWECLFPYSYDIRPGFTRQCYDSTNDTFEMFGNDEGVYMNWDEWGEEGMSIWDGIKTVRFSNASDYYSLEPIQLPNNITIDLMKKKIFRNDNGDDITASYPSYVFEMIETAQQDNEFQPYTCPLERPDFLFTNPYYTIIVNNNGSNKAYRVTATEL